MVHLITGAVNRGKSTKLRLIYHNLQKGDGFYNRRIFREDSLMGQEIIRLATGESRLFSLRNEFIPESWVQECRYGAFSFSKAGLEFGRKIIARSILNHLEPLFLDEIGPLELEGKGFCESFSNALVAKIEIYAVVRDSCLEAVIQKFRLKPCQINVLN